MRGLDGKIRDHLPEFMAMGENGMAEHQQHIDAGRHSGPANTLPMMSGNGPYGPIEMGGMFTLVKVRDDITPNDFSDPGWYHPPTATIAKRVSSNPNYGDPPRKPTAS
jgi:hypothetical protein